MFNTSISLDTLNSWGHGNMIDVLGIEFIDVQPDFIKAKMIMKPIMYWTM